MFVELCSCLLSMCNFLRFSSLYLTTLLAIRYTEAVANLGRCWVSFREIRRAFTTGLPYIGGGGVIREIILRKNVNTTSVLFPAVAGLWRFQGARRER
jgi:hypothetical protein